MDSFQRLTHELAPLGGDLLLDRYLEALAAMAAAARPAAPTPKPARRTETDDAAGAAAAVPAARPAATPPASPAPAADEVEAFMQRDAIEGTSEDEVQEFLKERAGFDPTELE